MDRTGFEVGPQFWRDLLAEVAPSGQVSPIDPSRMLRQPDARTQAYSGTSQGMYPGAQQGMSQGMGGAPNWGQILSNPDGLRKWLMQMMFAGRMGL